MLGYLIWTVICLTVLFVSLRNMHVLNTGPYYSKEEYSFDKLAFPRWVYLILFVVGIIPVANIIIVLLFLITFLVMFFITDDGVPCLWRFHIRNKIFNKIRDYLNKEV